MRAETSDRQIVLQTPEEPIEEDVRSVVVPGELLSPEAMGLGRGLIAGFLEMRLRSTAAGVSEGEIPVDTGVLLRLAFLDAAGGIEPAMLALPNFYLRLASAEQLQGLAHELAGMIEEGALLAPEVPGVGLMYFDGAEIV